MKKNTNEMIEKEEDIDLRMNVIPSDSQVQDETQSNEELKPLGEYIDCVSMFDTVMAESKLKLDIMKDIFKDKLKTPLLYIIRTTEDKASEVYAKNIEKRCEEVGIIAVNLLAENGYTDIVNQVAASSVNAYQRGGVILCQPLHESITENEKEEIIKFIDKECDVDGLGENPYYTPCTSLSVKYIMERLIEKGVLEENYANTNVLVIGRSKHVGLPITKYLQTTNATVTMCHSKTKDLQVYIDNADVIISSVGKANFINAEMLKNNKSDRLTLIDVGINTDENGKLCGDFSKDVINVAKYVTKVPNGVGTLTTAMLLSNVVSAVERGLSYFGNSNKIFNDYLVKYYKMMNNTKDIK